MTIGAHLEAIHAVTRAASQLTLVCTEIVGPLNMAVALPTAKVLGETVPYGLTRQLDKLDKKERKK